MAKTVRGIKKFLLWRLLKDAETSAGAKIAFQTEHEVTSTKDSNATQTKDGVIRTSGQIEQEINVTVYLSTSDEVDKLKEAHEKDEKVEVWDVVAEEPDVSSNYKMTYYQAYISEISESAPTDEGVEVSLTFAIDGVGKRGKGKLSEAQEKAISYLFVTPETGTTQEKAQESL